MNLINVRLFLSRQQNSDINASHTIVNPSVLPSLDTSPWIESLSRALSEARVSVSTIVMEVVMGFVCDRES